jgi:2-hydroxychromene-2-carboxylate isomerase
LRSLRFYFDYLSHNAYLAWTQLPELESRFGVEVEPVPVLFAGLLEAHGQLGPAEVLPKSIWMARNVLRKAALLGVELNPPRHHPWNPLLSLRISGAPLPAPQRRALIDALFRGAWVDGRHLSEPAEVEAIAAGAGLDGPGLVRAAQQPEAKARLREQTDAAIAEGVFGVPTLIVEDQLFWGYDDWPYLELYLAGKDPLDPREASRWFASVRPSAVRKRSAQRAAGERSSSS